MSTAQSKKPKVIPTVDAAGAIALMDKIFMTKTLDVSVFVDGRTGSGPDTYIYIIQDGDGQKPLAYMSRATLDELERTKAVWPNNMVPYKQRQNYQYRGKGWFARFSRAMLGAAKAIPRLTPQQRAVVARAMHRYMGDNRSIPKTWEGNKDGDYVAKFAGAGLVLTFGWSMHGGRYLSSVRRMTAKKLAVS